MCGNCTRTNSVIKGSYFFLFMLSSESKLQHRKDGIIIIKANTIDRSPI